ncbi:hypothetical protein AGDE_15648 [Angomonas deanei]|uniref:Uncharacterized protein n=1 Tax=Angomonas deanei TaxID=59799 RepID=A0A7G2CI96_9TRYP|nr:hypothetical protein AGDE_15648 [Angomonas deanei]CAD2219580.1 hypothetical protein, conserved [Angomonas deanei]|eukprot:EPY18713.1 hypothetical protein AGDE_15648 [Angomonas deanei]
MKRRRTRKLIQAAKEKREAEELLAVQTCAVPNRAQSSRDRFQKSKEQRRKIRGESEADTAPNSPPTGTRIATSPYTSPTISSPPPQVVTPLALAANGISTKAIDMYNKDSDTFKLGVIHRLLQAPQTLLYTCAWRWGTFLSARRWPMPSPSRITTAPTRHFLRKESRPPKRSVPPPSPIFGLR